MTERDKPKSSSSKGSANDREARLKAALKANLGRRKAQSRARAAQPNDKNEQNGTED
ncbi:hypothetical protein PGB28_14480 [Primorskyibacter aestuariivivens]|uniref:hypothetical protein n=1 Tax=Primorskyibacter aestuariivivens TaxID=1888912 RepID=UPI002301E10F|nr:hypothetical protein [Primorskyibacter aestuariivivens]MDA7429672.1 hypothetical protein [Primorskyibacter aestuariivivens]